MGKVIDYESLIGQKFNLLQTIKFEGFSKKDKRGKRRSLFLCKCDCGNLVLKTYHDIISKIHPIMSCGCLRKKEKNKKWTGKGKLSGNRFGDYRRGASIRNIEFKITIDDVYNLFLEQNQKCALTGLNLIIDDNRKTCSASLDRINSEKGYTPDNIQWIHKDVNRMKNCFKEDYFIKICKLIVDHAQLKEDDDKTQLSQEVACSGGVCDVIIV